MSLIFTYGTITLYGCSFQNYSVNLLIALLNYPQPQGQVPGLGSFLFARRYLENRFFFLFLRVLRCFNSPGLPPWSYFIHFTVQRSSHCGFPHSDICGSMAICAYPQLFAAYRVLRRLLVPRHSPCALSSLTFVVVSSPISLRSFIILKKAFFRITFLIA